MKAFILTILYLSVGLISAQKINIRDYGAKGDGKSDDTNALQKALDFANKTYAANRKTATLFVPIGTYLVNKPLTFNKYISIEGEFINSSIIRMTKSNSEFIIMEKSRDEGTIYNSYNYVKNLTLQGPEFSGDPFAEKNTASYKNSIGIKIMGMRTRLQDLQIEGFPTAAIDIRAAYYTFINNCFIKNNAIGINIDEMATSTYITNNELRFNSIAIMIQGNSFANFINNNMIETNMARYLGYDLSDTLNNTKSTGRGLVLKNSEANIITSNYFENQFINITIDQSNKNQINNNFIAIADVNIAKDKNQVPLQITGNSLHNVYQNNSYLTTTPSLNANKIIISTDDLSTNTIDVGADNAKIRTQFNTKQKDSKKLPRIPN